MNEAECYNCGLDRAPYRTYEAPDGTRIELCSVCVATYKDRYGGFVVVAEEEQPMWRIPVNEGPYRITLNKREFDTLSKILSHVIVESRLGLTDEETAVATKVLLAQPENKVYH